MDFTLTLHVLKIKATIMFLRNVPKLHYKNGNKFSTTPKGTRTCS